MNVAGVVERVEVKGLVDILVFTFGLSVRGVVVTRVVQCVNVFAFAPRYERILLNGIQMIWKDHIVKTS